ncbi:MAG: hypothetical protein ACLGHT_09705 [Acidimicrobiia bacterium]
MSLALTRDPQQSARTAAAAAAAVLALASTGDTVLLAMLLGVSAMSAAAGGVGVLVALALVARWGTTSLQALSGAQTVLGPAVVVGSALEIAACVLAAVALLLVSPADWRAVAFGSAAALVLAGPRLGATDLADSAVRVVATLAGTGIAIAVARRLPADLGRVSATAAAAAAVALGALG